MDRKIVVPAAVVGLGGLLAFFFRDRVRQSVTWVKDNLLDSEQSLQDWNAAAEKQLAEIQAALNRIADTLKKAEAH